MKITDKMALFGTMMIQNNPFYNPTVTREQATRMINDSHLMPILRRSSHDGLYAVTYYCDVRRSVIHSLLRQNADLSIDVLDDDHNIYNHYDNIYSLLLLIVRGPAVAFMGGRGGPPAVAAVNSRPPGGEPETV